MLGQTLYTLGQICVSIVCDEVREKMESQHQVEVDTLSCKYVDDVTGCVATDNDEDLQVSVDNMM